MLITHRLQSCSVLSELGVLQPKKLLGSDKEKALFTPATRLAHQNMLRHVANGCLTDPPGDVEYKGADGHPYKIRGTSQLEAVHRLLHHLFQSSRIGPAAAHALTTDFLYKHSVRHIVY